MNRYAALTLIALAGCLKASTAPAPTADLAAARVPADAQWQIREAQGDRLVLVAQVRHLPQLRPAIHLALRLPEQVRLLQGPREWTVTSEDPVLVERELVFEVHGSPSDDIVLVADSRAEGFGWHLERRYSFQPTPPPAPIERSGASLQVGKRDFGPSVELEGE